MHVPAAIRQGHKSNTGFDKPPRQQHPLAGLMTAIFVPDFLRFRGDIKGSLSLGRTDKVVRSLIESVDRSDVIRVFHPLEMTADYFTEPPPRLKSVTVHSLRKREVPNGEIVAGRIRTERERAERTAEVARPGVGSGQIGQADIRWQIGPGAEFMRDNASKARKRQRRAGLVPGEHVVGSPLVGCLTMGHRTDDGNFVGNLRGSFQMLVEPHARDHGFNAAQFTAVFQRRERLGVKGLLLRPAAGQPDVNHALGGAFEVLKLLRVGQHGLCLQERPE